MRQQESLGDTQNTMLPPDNEKELSIANVRSQAKAIKNGFHFIFVTFQLL